MTRFGPIERLPDGTLFHLTPGQARSVRGLTKRCCNYTQGDCLLLGGVCPQAVSRSLDLSVVPPRRAAGAAEAGTGHSDT